MGVATLSDLIGFLLSPDDVKALAAMMMMETASTTCETLNMLHLSVRFVICACAMLLLAVYQHTHTHAHTYTHIHIQRITIIIYTGGRGICHMIIFFVTCDLR